MINSSGDNNGNAQSKQNYAISHIDIPKICVGIFKFVLNKSNNFFSLFPEALATSIYIAVVDIVIAVLDVVTFIAVVAIDVFAIVVVLDVVATVVVNVVVASVVLNHCHHLGGGC